MPDGGPTGGHVPASGEEGHESEASSHATDDFAKFICRCGIARLARGEDFGAVVEGGDRTVLLGHQARLVSQAASALVRDAIVLDAGQHVEHLGSLAVHLDGDRQPPAVREHDVVVEGVGARATVGIDVSYARVLGMDFPNAFPCLEKIGDAELEKAFMPEDDPAEDRVAT